MRRALLLTLLATALLTPAAGASSWTVTGHSAQGGVAFRIHNDGDRVWTTDFHFVTRCGTRIVARRLYWAETRSQFRFRSPHGRVAFYSYVFTGPDGGGYGWVRDRRANGCDSGRLKFALDQT